MALSEELKHHVEGYLDTFDIADDKLNFWSHSNYRAFRQSEFFAND